MSLIRRNKGRFPMSNTWVDFFNRDEFLNDDFFSFEKSLPAINVKENEDRFEIELAAPGFQKKDFEITLNDDVLEVSAQKQEEDVVKEGEYTRQEFNYNSFKRTMQLPPVVDGDKKVKATYKDGILKFDLLKKEAAKEKPKRIIEVV